ncbi:AraC family transcriptional regulator [Vallitalea okinawensis]|uniref:AraC family transcriptional regulator n=1 Tax=Vallitalea okinawensis TaxID=2078660 RepID=UPI001478E6DE|nr:AraC family transcriptional regulator [Vallitalea okinawensis]
MQYEYEIIKHFEGLPFKAFIVNIGFREYHWHSELEILWVLKGSVILQLDIGDRILQEGEIFILNTNDVHCLKETNEENLILALQINEDIVSKYFKRLSQIQFNIKDIGVNHELSVRMKRKMASIMIAVFKGDSHELMKSVGYLNLLMSDMFNELPYQILDKNQKKLKDIDLERVQRIISYVYMNYSTKITLQDLADHEYLSRYRMSHFIKEKLGINFQNFLNKIRMEKAINLILKTDENILAISEKCGFSDIKYLNKLLKEEYSLTATGIRKNALNKKYQLFHIVDSKHKTFDRKEAIDLLNNYI